MKPKLLIGLVSSILLALLCSPVHPHAIASPPSQQDSPVDSKQIPGSPLTIYVGSNASIQVYHQNYTHGATYGSGDSGFFIALGSTLYGPDLLNTNTSSASVGTSQLTLVSHDGPTGSGSASDPYRITTVHRLNDLQVTQVVSYINGNNYFQLDWQISNSGGSETCLRAYHAADIYFADSDGGYGYYNAASGSVGGFDLNRSWFMVFAPLTPATHHKEAHFATIWSDLSATASLDDTIDSTYIDNGIALQWDPCIAAGGSTTISDLWSFGESEAAVIPTVIAGGGGSTTPTGSVDVWAKDSPEDNGSTPSTALNGAWWTSPDIIVRNNADGLHFHQNPIQGKTNYIYLNLRNRGSANSSTVRATVYWANPALGLFWPTSWNEIGTREATIPANSDTWTLPVEWNPPGTGHYCLLVRLESTEDPIRAEGDVPGDNNIAQRNVHVLGFPRSIFNPTAGGSVEAIAVGPPNGSDNIDIVVQTPTASAEVTVSVTLPPDLFRRWQDAGGTVEGGEVDGDRIITSGLTETVIHDLPLEPGEEAKIKIDIEGPTEQRYIVSVIERVDEQDVGGNTYVYEGLIPGLPVDLPKGSAIFVLICPMCWLGILLVLVVLAITRLRRKPKMIPQQAGYR